MSNEHRCPHCGNTIKPLTQHAHESSACRKHVIIRGAAEMDEEMRELLGRAAVAAVEQYQEIAKDIRP